MTEDLQRRLTKYSGGVDLRNFDLFGKDMGDLIGDAFKDLLANAEIPAHITAKYGKHLGNHVSVNRVALTIDQVKEHNLMSNPTKRADSRTQKYVAEFGDECWELDAIPPDDLQTLVTSSIEQYIDRDRWDAALEEEEKDRADLKERFANIDIDLGEDDEKDTGEED